MSTGNVWSRKRSKYFTKVLLRIEYVPNRENVGIMGKSKER